MSIWSKFALWFRSVFNSKADALTDPAKALPVLVNDMRDEFLSVKRLVAQTMADEISMRRKLEAETAKADEWEKKAELAVKNNREDLAVAALAQRDASLKLAADYRKNLGVLSAHCNTLRKKLKTMEQQVNSASTQAHLLTARQRIAEASQRAEETINATANSGNSAFSVFAQMEERIAQMEATAEATVELNEDFSGQSLESKFADLEQDTSGNQALMDLKRRMGMLSEDAAPAVVNEAAESFDFSEMEQELAMASSAKLQAASASR